MTTKGAEIITLDSPEDIPKTRLDKWLSGSLPDISRSRLKALIESGQVTGGGVTISEPSQTVKPSLTYTVNIPESVQAEPIAQDIPLDVVYEDDDVIVVNKPPGMVVHPAPGSPDGTLVNALLAHCGESLSGIGGVKRPGIVHRIDKNTSGLLVSAKNDHAHQVLAKQFEEHTLERQYKAIVWGVPQPLEGKIEGRIGRSRADRKKMAVVKYGGKAAQTHYKVLKVYGSGVASLIECQLETGRTHQIRVHLCSIGHPLIGDPVYGRSRKGSMKKLSESARSAIERFHRQALHAVVIGFVHPKTNEMIIFSSDLPCDFKALEDSLDCG